jgi:hypothetical protein
MKEYECKEMKNVKNIYRNIPKALLVCLVIFVISISFTDKAFSDEGAIMKGASALWPAETDGWKIAEGPTPYDTVTAYKYMNGAAELFIAFNMRSLTVVRYEKPGQPAITLELFGMAAPEDAYGLFSFESDDPKGSIGQGSEFGGGLLRFWKANYFVSVYGDGQGAAVEAATLSLGSRIASSIKETGNPPKILAFLPDGLKQFAKSQAWFLHSHILLNQRFFIAYENILDLSGDVNVALGRYAHNKDRVHLLIVKYPSQLRADEAFKGFKKAYMNDGAARISVKTENNKWTSATEYGDYLVIVFDAPDEPFAKQMIEQTAERLKEGK